MSKVGQSKIETFVEVFFSNILSYLIDVVFVVVAAPLLGFDIGLDTVTIGVAILYAIHLLKSFLYRRFWNWLLVRQHRAKNDDKYKK